MHLLTAVLFNRLCVTTPVRTCRGGQGAFPCQPYGCLEGYVPLRRIRSIVGQGCFMGSLAHGSLLHHPLITRTSNFLLIKCSWSYMVDNPWLGSSYHGWYYFCLVTRFGAPVSMSPIASAFRPGLSFTGDIL